MSTAAQSQASGFLPEEIVSNILTRLPVKSICRCKCVCKTWLSIISAQLFVDSHFARSKSQPNLLITFCKDKSRYIFIADPTPDQQKGTSLVLRYLVTMPAKYPPCSWTISPEESQSVGGLMFSLCSQYLIQIANPSTNKLAAFSRAFPPNYSSPSTHTKTYVYVCLGFDPVEGKHKLLQSISMFGRSTNQVERTEHLVITVGDDTNCWRYVKDGPSINRGVQPYSSEICVNGVIYFEAWIKWASRGIEGWEQGMVAFDVRSESFQAVRFSIEGRFNGPNHHPWRYVEFEGKVAIVDYPLSNRICYYDHGYRKRALELWVLEDFQKQVWSLKFAALPPVPMETDDMIDPKHKLVGTTHDGKLIFAVFEEGSYYDTNIRKVTEKDKGVPFSFLFFDMKTGDFRSSKVCFPEGFALTGHIKITAMGHVETLLSI